MAISTDITSQDAVKLITEGVRLQLENDIYKELQDYINPKLKTIAENAARTTCHQALVHISRDHAMDRLLVNVMFGEVNASKSS